LGRSIVIIFIFLLRVRYIWSVNVVRARLGFFLFVIIHFCIFFGFFIYFLNLSLAYQRTLFLLLNLNFLIINLFRCSLLGLVGVRCQSQVARLAGKHLLTRLLYAALRDVLQLWTLSTMYDFWFVVIVRIITLLFHFVERKQILLPPLEIIELLGKL
jgi:hypothetical protein